MLNDINNPSYFETLKSSLDFESYIEKNWLINSSSEDKIIRSQLPLHIAACLILAPTALIKSALHIIAGIGTGALAMGFCGKNRTLVNMALKNIEASSELFRSPYLYVIKMLNPNFNLVNFREAAEDNEPYVTKKINAFIEFCEDEAAKYADCPNPKNNKKDLASRVTYLAEVTGNVLKEQVLSRLIYIGIAIASLVLAILEGAVGVLSSLASILTLGRFSELNYFAYHTLGASAVIQATLFCFVKTVNPLANLDLYEQGNDQLSESSQLVDHTGRIHGSDFLRGQHTLECSTTSLERTTNS